LPLGAKLTCLAFRTPSSDAMSQQPADCSAEANAGLGFDAKAMSQPPADSPAAVAGAAAVLADKNGKPLTKLPRGILPDGINCPPGTDIMQFCRDLAESGADFAEQFDRDSATFHGNRYGGTAAVPIGGIEGGRVPASMQEKEMTSGGAVAGAVADWRTLPDAPLAIEEDFGPDFHAAMAAHVQLNQCKKAISVLNKPVEMAMRLRHQYKDAEGDDKTVLESRWKGAENQRDGALSAATETIRQMGDDVISQRTRDCVKDVVVEGKFQFEDKERFGEYMQVLQRANQSIFMDQKRLLARIKDIKKAAKATQKFDTPAGYGAQDTVPTSETVAGGA